MLFRKTTLILENYQQNIFINQDLAMKGNGFKVKEMEKEFISGQMVHNIQENGFKMLLKAKVILFII